MVQYVDIRIYGYDNFDGKSELVLIIILISRSFLACEQALWWGKGENVNLRPDNIKT